MEIFDAVKICNDIKKLRRNSDVELCFEYRASRDRTRYTMGFVEYYLYGPNLNKKQTTHNIIIAERHGIHFSNDKYDRFGIKELEPVGFSVEIKDIRQLLQHHGFYHAIGTGLPARILYHRLKREYAKQQKGRQK